ncbi:hypothetical protein DMN91_012189 [Ooceraea biroi]|uniref:Uncharacterized protein n=1 Tax=Ooceraea biroi TaxID=2015173 RepID=A0A3L8D411_OOCBI|nr:hypothetical protein DMN91_012189 [Ooceraea biroi]
MIGIDSEIITHSHTCMYMSVCVYIYFVLAYKGHESMILGAASTLSNENVQRATNVDNVEGASGVQDVQDLREAFENLREARSFSHDALNYSAPGGPPSPPRINQSSLREGCREDQQQRQRRRRRRWKLDSCFRCTSATGDEARSSRCNQPRIDCHEII